VYIENHLVAPIYLIYEARLPCVDVAESRASLPIDVFSLHMRSLACLLLLLLMRGSASASLALTSENRQHRVRPNES
jgi:hypothetical protein